MGETPNADSVRWVTVDVDDRPVFGPPCPGPTSHRWSLTIEEGQVTLLSGCDDCQDVVFGPANGEDVAMNVTVSGRLDSHLERYGWETPEYDHWWEFVPTQIDGSGAPEVTS